MIHMSKSGFKGLCKVCVSSQGKHKSTGSLINSLHSHHSVPLLGILDSQSELHALLKTEAFILQSKELSENCLCSQSFYVRSPTYFPFLLFLLIPHFSSLHRVPLLSLFAHIQSWDVMDTPKVQMTG